MLSCFPLGYFFYDSYNYIWSLYWIIQFYNKNAYSLVRFILNKTHLNQRNMMQICVIMVQRMLFLPKLFVGKIKQFYFLFASQFKRFGYILFNLYEFQIFWDTRYLHGRNSNSEHVYETFG